MPADPMLQATTQILAYVREGEYPDDPNPMHRARVSWEADLRTQEKGGSGNKGWLAWLWEYIAGRRSEEARAYLITRLRWELSRGLMAHEQLSPTYGGLHLGCVTILWHLAWYRGDEEIARLAGAWIERVLLLECLTGRREGGRIRPMSPGMRADVRSVTHGRQVEGAIVGLLLGIPQGLRLDNDDWWGPLWGAVQACEGVERVAERVRGSCSALLTHKKIWVYGLKAIRLMVPMRWHSWPNGDCWAWVDRTTGASQDPAKMGGGVIAGEHVFLWPWEDGSDPSEEGWRAEAKAVIVSPANKNAWRRRVEAIWYRKGHLVKEDWLNLPPGPPPELIGAQDGPDPLGDLPEAPDQAGHPWRQGGGAGGRPGPEPEKPVDVPWDLGVLRENLQGIRDDDRARWKRVTAHRALATLDRLGAWEGLEEEVRE